VLWPTQVSAEGTYLVNMLPALTLMGMGLGAAQQIGGSLGIALFITIAAAATAGAAGSNQTAALSAGYSSVFLWAAGVAILITPGDFKTNGRRRRDLPPSSAFLWWCLPNRLVGQVLALGFRDSEHERDADGQQ
jgi:hypothetical protein